MPVHVFPVQSVKESVLGGDSIDDVYRLARTYLTERGQSGETSDKYMKCKDRGAFNAAVNEFLLWSKQWSEEDPKVLWLSLHGKPPVDPKNLGTSGHSAEYEPSEPESDEIVDWCTAFGNLRGNIPNNVVIVLDVCWGASPTAPARLTAKGRTNPAMFFGPVRAAHRLELDTATGLIFGMLAEGRVPEVEEARAAVQQLNTCFPNDSANDKPFYRVWWWDQEGQIQRYPDASQQKIRPRHVL